MSGHAELMAKPVYREAAAAPESDRIGFFGKVPSHGDFISDGFDRDLLGKIDEWLRAGLHACAVGRLKPAKNRTRPVPVRHSATGEQ